MSDVKPIRPSECAKLKTDKVVPPGVLTAWNGLLVKKFSGRTATISQKDAVAAICVEMNCTSNEVYKQGWLDIETIYEKAGWKVEYDKPGYNESYEPTFKFTKKTR